MRAELLKIRSLPTPYWTGLAMVICFFGGITASIAWGATTDTVDVAISLPTWFGSMILGVWIVGLEFGQDTLRRTFTADPRRLQALLAKLAVVAVIVSVVTFVLVMVGGLLYGWIGPGPDAPDLDLVLRIAAATVVSNLIAATVGFALTLLTRSMAGGMTVTLVFFFVLDSVLTLIPKVGDYALGAVSSDVDEAIRGTSGGPFGDPTGLSTGLAVFVLVVWIAALLAAGVFRTLKTDVK